MSFNGVEARTLNDIAVPTEPGRIYDHPAELIEDASVGKDVKRALLAAWASDRHAIEGAPSLRQLESGAIVNLDDILQALKTLDQRAVAVASPKPSRPASRLLRRPAPIRVPKAHHNDEPPTRPMRMRVAHRAAECVR